MKAIEELEKIKNCLIPTKATLDFMIDEVIAELEALENRSCENCKIMISDHTMDNDLYCTKLNKWVEKSFSCNKWESR